MKKIKNIHFVGIKGVGMTPLAIIAKEAGFAVTGCDTQDSFITDEPLKKAGINPLVGFDNPENLEAKNLDIPILTQGEAIAKFQSGEFFGKKYEGISIAGTHGKTTTTAMIAVVLKANKLDPSFAVGTGMIPFLDSDGHFGKGKYFVAEADEYATEPKYDKTPKMLLQKPNIGVITNIEYDHPDVYASLEDLKRAFLKFAEGISKDGVLITNIDNENVRELLRFYKGNVITYGFSKTAEFVLTRVNIEQDKTFFWIERNDVSLGEFSINVSGEHNALNALAAIISCTELGLPIEQIKKGLLSFKGTKRRMEYIKTTYQGALVFDDYAHHPTEIRKTLETLRKTYPSKKIVCIFQPHTYSRTKSLFEQFKSSFTDVTELILTKIYSSKRETPDPLVSSEILAQQISTTKNGVIYTENLEDVVKYVVSKAYGREYIIITMGAGDVYKILEEIN